MKALYRRYRPKTLDEIVGQEQVTEVLKKSIASGKIAHAYLFIGPRGCGKTSAARIVAHEINKFKYELEDDYLDIIEIDGASNTGVDNIRDLREKAIIAPTQGKYKIYIIDEVHMLSKNAFNALLKTLEEPPEHVVFIMATTDAQKIPITITSRSQIYTFKLADPSTMFEHVKKICKKEKIDIDDEAIKIIVRRGGGSFRDTLSILDQISTMNDSKITAEIINRAFGLPQDESIQQILAAYTAGNYDTIREQLNSLYATGIKPEVISENLVSAIVENPQAIYLPLADKLIDVSRSTYPQVKLLLALTLTNTAPQIDAQPVAAPVAAPIAPKVAAAIAPAPKPSPAPNVEAEQKPVEAAPEPSAADIKPVQPITVSASASDDEFWNSILTHFKEANDPAFLSILNQASGCQYDGKTVKVYAGGSFTYKRLDKERAKLMAVLPENCELAIEQGTLIRDQNVADIAAIMGGGEEVTIDE